MVEYTGINHLAMATGDMDATIEFWRDLLGMPMVAASGRPGYRQYFFEISQDDMIAFFEWPRVRPVEEKDHGAPVDGPLAFDHVSFGVRDLDDLFVIRARLEAAGFWVSEAVDHGFIRSIYSFDPNNIAIEFTAPNPGVDLRRNPRMADKDPTVTALEGPDPVPEKWPKPEPVEEQDKVLYPGEDQLGPENDQEVGNKHG